MLKQKRNKTFPWFSVIILVIVIVFFSAPHFSHAAGLVPCGGPNGENPCTFQDVFIMVAKVTNWLISMAGLVAVYNIVSAGFWMIVDMGNEEALTGRKKALSNAIIGLVIVMMAFMFINTAVNLVLHSRCSLDLTDPLSYLTIKDQNTCEQTVPVEKHP